MAPVAGIGKFGAYHHGLNAVVVPATWGSSSIGTIPVDLAVKNESNPYEHCVVAFV